MVNVTNLSALQTRTRHMVHAPAMMVIKRTIALANVMRVHPTLTAHMEAVRVIKDTK